MSLHLGSHAWQITEYIKLAAHISCNEVHNVIMSPGATLCVQHFLASVEVVVCCSPVPTQFEQEEYIHLLRLAGVGRVSMLALSMNCNVPDFN